MSKPETPPSPTLPALLTDAQVAHMLALPTVQSLRDMRYRGEGPRVTYLSANRVRYTPADVVDYINSCRRAPENKRKPRAKSEAT